MSKDYILVIDEGTTGVRAFIYNKKMEVVSTAYKNLIIHYPEDLSYECDATEIYRKAIEVCNEAIKLAKIQVEEIASLAITMQRLTWLLWDKTTGEPLRNSVVWLDKRAVRESKKWLEDEAFTTRFPERKVISPVSVPVFIKYFKDTDPDFKKKFDENNFLFGTVETYLMWMLTKGRTYATVRSNACAGSIWSTATLKWDEEMLDYVGIGMDQIPNLVDENGDFGYVDSSVFGIEIPIYGVIADQQSALFSQCGTKKNAVKCTNGTGTFIDVNVGDSFVAAPPLLSLVGWSFDDKITYIIEGTSPTCGVCLEWAKNNLNLFDDFSEMEPLANTVSDTGGAYFVPTFQGMRLPIFDYLAKGAMLGVRSSTTKAHMVRAILESLGFAVSIIVDTIKEKGVDISVVRMSGGASKSPILCQIVADVIGVKVEVPKSVEATAMGAAVLSAIKVGWTTMEESDNYLEIAKTYVPSNDNAEAIKRFGIWKTICERVCDLQLM